MTQRQIKHYPLDRVLTFNTPNKEVLTLQGQELSFILQDGVITECRLIAQLNPNQYRQLETEGWFQVSADAWIDMEAPQFETDRPIEMEAQLEQSILQALLTQHSTPEEIGAYYQTLPETEPQHPLLQENSWYGFYFKQEMTLPAHLAELGILKNLYTTRWAKAYEATVEKQEITLPDPPSLQEQVPAWDENSPYLDFPILRVMTDFLTSNGYIVSRREGETVINLQHEGKNGQWECYGDAREEDGLCCFYSVSPVNAPENKRSAIAEFIARINYILTVGNFEMDFADGEIRYRTSIDVEGDRLSTPLFRQLVTANITMMDRYLPAIRNIVENDISPSEAIAAIKT
jgi:hypothetical protein